MPGYAVTDRLPVDEVPAGTNVLVAGPPLTGKRELALDFLEDGCERGDGSIVVGTRDSTERIKARAPSVWRAVEERRGGIVDCVSRQRGDTVRDEDLVKYVGSPADITDIGIRLGGLFQALEDTCERVRVNVSTVSTMLMYADTRRVYRFLHVFSGHVERLDWLGLGVLDTSNKEAFDVLAPLYDGMVQTRATDDGTEVRVVGMGTGRTDWVPY